LSLESTSAHHKRHGHAVGKVITYWRLQLNFWNALSPLTHERKPAHHTRMQGKLGGGVAEVIKKAYCNISPDGLPVMLTC